MSKTTHENMNIPVYLLVVDSSDEFQVALKYAAKLAQSQGARLALLHALDEEEFMHWGGIQDRMHEEYRAEAEGELLEAAQLVNEYCSFVPALHLKDAGNLAQTVLDIIDGDENISKLILGGAAHTNSPGPLVAYFSGKGMTKLRVPLTIVPGNLDVSVMDELL